MVQKYIITRDFGREIGLDVLHSNYDGTYFIYPDWARTNEKIVRLNKRAALVLAELIGHCEVKPEVKLEIKHVKDC